MAKQLHLLPKFQSSYGGSLLKKRKARSYGRPLSVQNSMHLVLRSTQARGEKSFLKPSHANRIRMLVSKFAKSNQIQIFSLANVGNHLHLHIKLGARAGYKPFIRSLTGAIAVTIGQKSRWRPSVAKFWDLRPFTRIVQSFRARLTLAHYIEINRLEGLGYNRTQAKLLLGDQLKIGKVQSSA